MGADPTGRRPLVEHDDTARRMARRPRLRRAEPPGERARAPMPVPPTAWLLPDPVTADEDGVVGVGADLSPSTLVDAYRRGIFPWPHPDVALPWFSPDPRGVLVVDDVHVSRSLVRRLRTCGWTTTVDRAFRAVVAGCASDRGDGQGSWITPAMARAYARLHELGWAHSVEVWDGERLVGGLYGVQVGGVFTGESMFHAATDASKVAFVDLAVRMREAGGWVLDVQVTTPHLATLGVRDVPRDDWLDLLYALRDEPVLLSTARRATADLADLTRQLSSS